MPSISFLSSAFTLLVAACSVVQATPILESRREKATKPQVAGFAPRSFTSTAWGGDSKQANSGVRMYYTTNGGIQEIIMKNNGLVKNAKDAKWVKSDFLKSDAFNVPDVTSIYAVNTYPFGFDELQVYFVTESGANKTIRNWEYSGGSWRLGGLAIEVPNYDANSLSVNAFRLGSGYAVSIFYTEGGGYIQEFQRVNTDFWVWQGNVGKLNQGVTFTSGVDVIDNEVVKRIWSADNAQLTWRTSQPTWTTVQGYTRYVARYLKGVMLPDNEMRFYVTDGVSNDITEWSLDQWNWETKPSYKIKNVIKPSGSQIALATQTQKNKTWIYVFYHNEQDKLEMSVYNGDNWKGNSEVKI